MTLVRTIYARWQTLVHELAKFGIVGAVCYAISVVTYNVSHVTLGLGPITSLTISTVIAATCAYVGNRNWSFKHRARSGVRREYTLFIALNAVGLAIASLSLGFGFYVLGQTSVLAQNIWGNVVGQGAATVFRFWAYKRFVFLHPEHPKARVVPQGTPVVVERLPEPQPEAV